MQSTANTTRRYIIQFRTRHDAEWIFNEVGASASLGRAIALAYGLENTYDLRPGDVVVHDAHTGDVHYEG